MAAICSSRELKFSNKHPQYRGLKVSDLESLIAGLDGDQDIDFNVSVVKDDRGGVDQVTVTLSVRT
ncbi:hypothetical protein SEA_NEOEVIE_53 [Gordonia phage Neoevie]|uniref:Uncharacterized protein n=1 Tax=Gordonia phage Neoevie TaxID=2510574 RepID=A0A411B4Z0_9CAUD|nr:hypothetical protein SEA_NEOEVIE_53 [Gordonia phage Neoevie]